MKYRKKLWKQITVIPLIIAMLVVGLPAQALAAEPILAENASAGVDAPETAEISEETEVIGEDASRRDAYTKHYVLSDGSRQAVIYSEPVHYEEDGQWKDIDNTLAYEARTGTYKNKKNEFTACFDENPESDELLSLEKDGYTISWNYVQDDSMQRRARPTPKVAKKGRRKETHDAKGKPIKSSGEPLRYEDMDTSCDVEYIVTGNGVKENIILSEPSEQHTFTFEVTAKDMVLVTNQDGSISVKAKDDSEIFYIPAPFMYDDEGAYSDAVEYTVQNMGKDKYRLIVTADKTWLSAKERVYPVTIDPVIKTEQKREAISCTFISSDSDYKSTNFNDYMMLCVGWDTYAYEKTRTLIKFDLPELNKGDMVVGAYLNMYMYDAKFYADGMGEQQINVHKVTKSWSASTVTWNSDITYDSVVTDYDFFKKSDIGTNNAWTNLDVTKIVKGWYEGEDNYGLLLKKETESGTAGTDAAYAKFWSDKYNNVNDAFPMIQINYRNNKGLENYWNYTTVSGGAAGTAYVNDYSGNLVFEAPLAGTSGELLTANLSLVYNGYCANQEYVAGKNGSSETVVGRGFRLNFQQTLLPSSQYTENTETTTEWPYVYTDEDGTEHYFKRLTTDKEIDDYYYQYRDEDGLGLYMTMDVTFAGDYEITDGRGNYWCFNAKGNLCRILDQNMNEITISYANGERKQISKITDANGHYYTFQYQTVNGVNDYVQSITDDAGRSISFYYDGGCLSRIQYPDGTNSYYTYTSKNKCLETTKDANNFKLIFDYLSVKGTIRVSDVKEKVGTAEGQEISFDRTAYNTTVVRSGGVDGTHKNQDSTKASDDIVTIYQFDNLGRTTSTQVEYGNGEEAGASVAGYTSTSDDQTASPTKNKVSSQAGLGKNIINLLQNGNFESTDNWQYSKPSGVTGSVSTSTISYFGKHSAYISSTAISQPAICNITQTVTGLTAGKTYTFSAYVKTGNITRKVNEGGAYGAYLWMYALDSAGTRIGNAYSKFVTEKTDTEINDGWRRINVSLNIPENTATVYLRMCFKDSIGTVRFDGAQLEIGSVANDYNMIENSNFERVSSGMPVGWSSSSITYSANSSGTVQNGITTARAKKGSRSMRVIGEAKKAKGLSQTIPVEGNPNDTYILSGWGFANAINDTFHKDAKFEISVKVKYSVSDGSTTSQEKDGAKFNTSVYGWQYAIVPIVLAYKDGEDDLTYTPTSIEIICRYWHQENSCYFDHIQLIKDVASSYQYDSKGNVVSVAANAQQKENMEYSGKDLTKYKDPEGNKYTFEYDLWHNLQKSTLPSGTFTRYARNSQGLVTSQALRNSSGTLGIKSWNSYSEEEGNLNESAYLMSTTDAYGNVTEYEYHKASGQTTSVTAANNSKTDYNYNADYTRLLGVENTTTEVNYAYNNNLLTGITFSKLNDNTEKENYGFTYDVYGNVLQTKVGNKTLSTNNYINYNGLLESSLYGNGDGIKYVYDKMGNVSLIYQKHDTNAAFNTYSSYFWQYATDGTPLVHQDGINQLRYEYMYDAIGRLIRQHMSKTTDSSNVGYVEYGYDNRNNLSKITNAIGTETLTQYYLYNADGLAEKYATSKGQAVLYDYDGLNRLNSKALYHSLTLEPVIQTEYTYFNSKKDASCTTTNLKTEKIKGTEYKYTYDYLWNMKGITKDGVEYRSYEYDNYSQLTRENNKSVNKSTVWEYDALGNIESVTTYDYSTADTLQNEKEVVSYTYGTDTDAGWNKLLKSITTTTHNEDDTTTTVTETIDYDAIGNPISYRGATMGWYGRQMTSYAKNGTTITNTYDVEGIRGSKTVNGSKTTYQYLDGKLYYEKRGDGRELYYLYDSYGSLVLIRMYYNGTASVYYVATNSQGDVIGLYTYTGELVATYEYDAWGNATITKPGTDGTPIDITNSTEEHIGLLNPIRYRGYYYDADMGLYYLQSRYYDASIGRFINADSIIAGVGSEPLGYAIYTYCMNNPVNMSDAAGNLPKWAAITIGIAAAAVAVAVTVVSLGSAAPAAACGLTGVVMSLGASYTVASATAAVAVAATVATAAVYAGDIAYSSVTGNSPLKDTVFRGNENAYNTGLMLSGMATGGMLDMAAQSPGICFVAGTKVLTVMGKKNIEDIRFGELVWSENPETGEKGLKRVIQTFVNETEQLVHVFAKGEEIVATPEHPFYVPKKGWIGAIHLQAGDVLVLKSGEYVVVELIQHEILEAPVTVYNFEVEDFHTYYVGEKSILVHNKCIVNQHGVKVDVRTSNEHGLPHGHVSGNGPSTTIGLNQRPMKNHPDFSRKQWTVIQDNWEAIKNGIINLFPKQ